MSLCRWHHQNGDWHPMSFNMWQNITWGGVIEERLPFSYKVYMLVQHGFCSKVMISVRTNNCLEESGLFRAWSISWILTRWGGVMHICMSKLSQYMNQCCHIVYWILRSKLQWNYNRNSYIFIQENVFENVVCEIVAILSQPQCVKSILPTVWQLQSYHIA